ncbi:methyltransferase domain-containing protein [Undibacterium sp.]|uniref:methyltransferase domain-containing protein n=1 Tax=Undibacterium sp. TaxID=1914977 RepID=UPI0025EFBE56|nr:methyltransferase domain-containing protein [Undibacterium sp.]
MNRTTMLNEREAESCYLGQFIPLHYHHNMLMDSNRMQAFKTAIQHVVFPGAKVLELGGGTGVLSWFAAQQAEKVWCVEFNPDMVNEARRLLAQNPQGEKVEVIHADAFEYLPPEPVDVVICEMIHVAMLREKLLEVIANFKQRYLEKFGGPLPIFMPEAIIMAVQPMQQEYNFEGYSAPIVQFQETTAIYTNSRQLAEPAVYSIIDFSAPIDMLISWQGSFSMTEDGNLNALRFITKNILSVLQQQSSTIDWLNHYMVLPLPSALQVKAGDIIDVSFRYRGGASIASLQNALQAVIRQPESITVRGEAVFA